MTDNGGERRDSDAEDSWFKPSENRYRTQSDYQDPLESEGTADTVFPDSGGYAGLSSSRPAMVEPYPEALGGPPPPASHGISYPGAGSAAYQPLTRVPGEAEEPSLPSVAASAQVPLPSERDTDRPEAWSDGPRTQEFPALDDRDAPDAGQLRDEPSSAPGSAAEQPWAPGAPVDEDRGAPSWDAPSPGASGQPWDEAPSSGVSGGQPWNEAPSSGASGQPWDDAPPSAASGGQPWDEAPSSGVSGGQPWEDAPVADRRDPLDDGLGTASWDVPAPAARPWEDDTRSPSSWDAEVPAGGDDRGASAPWSDSPGTGGSVESGSADGSRPWDTPSSSALGQPWDDAPARARDTSDDGLGPASWETPSSAASGGQPWDEAPSSGVSGGQPWEDAPVADRRDPLDDGLGTASWDVPAPAARPWEDETRSPSSWDADASGSGGPVEDARPWDTGSADAPGAWNADRGAQPWEDAPAGGTRDPLDDGLGPASWESPAAGASGQPWDDNAPGRGRDAADDGLGPASWETRPSSATDQPWGPDPVGDRGPWTADRGGRPWEDDTRASSGWDDDAPDRERGQASWTDVPGPDGGSWDDGAPADRLLDDRAPRHGTGERAAEAWDDRPYGDDPLGGDRARGRSWDDDELGGDFGGADSAPAGADAPDAWAPSGRTDDRPGAGSGGSWGDGYGDELSPSGLGSGSGNTWAFDRNDPRLPDVVREAEQRRRESSSGRAETVDWGGPDTGELSAAVPGADDPLGAIADMQSRARSREQDPLEDPGGATQMFDARALAGEGGWADDDEYRRDDRRGDGEADYDRYDDDPDGPEYDQEGPEYGRDGDADLPEPEYGYDDDPEPHGDERRDRDDSEYEDGFTPADYGMPAAPAGRSRRRKDPIAEEFPGFGDRPLGGEAGDAYPGYDSIDFLADTERGATLTLWLGVASLLPGVGLVTAVLALLVTGPKAKRAIRESRGQLDGLGLITTGTVFAVVGILVTVISVALWLVL
ncbi:hypothetical protein [Nocardiopsis sp. HUAS JQ3]|uniref:hypothetical protein n=1 Tax=Nocardiopsis sp. HUAS JQ3 TaxID=3061629 RepID=UPI0023A917B9|nr:hypothetical protein [Nocardiopsis sp. HUAS JQ3]WDZ91651.1 hypothetical protein PV789_03540 [Nocardiopsis sp. HUAS JQ3]